MMTKETLIAEIGRVQPQDMETVFKLIQVFTLSTHDISSKAEHQWARHLGSLRDSVKILGDIVAPAL